MRGNKEVEERYFWSKIKYMDYQISYLDPMGIIVVKTKGKMNADDFLAMARAMLQHPRHSKGGNVIFDHSALEFSGVPVSALQKIRAFHMDNEGETGNGKSAIIVKAGLSKEWHKLWSQGEKIKTGNKVMIFESYDDAVNWIKGV